MTAKKRQKKERADRRNNKECNNCVVKYNDAKQNPVKKAPKQSHLVAR